MTDEQYESLSGRIEGVGRAVMSLAALLEEQGVIDGPQVSAAWRAAMGELPPKRLQLQIAQAALRQMAHELDAVRRHRGKAPGGL